MTDSLDFSHAYETNFSAMGIDYPVGMSAFDAARLRIPRPDPAMTAQREYDLKAYAKRLANAERARASSKRKNVARADKRAFAKSQISLDPNSRSTSDKLAKLVGKPNHKRSS